MSEGSREALVETIRASIIGDDEALNGPFGLRRITYADYTASGRNLSFIEQYLCDEVMARYANTHTETSATGRQTTRFREEARQIIKHALDASDDDVLIFCGSGATAAVNKLLGILNLRIPNDLDRRYGFSKQIAEADRPVVFVGPYEHHSNELPWKESIADVVHIGEDSDGGIDVAELAEQLDRHASRKLKIGSFSAASNVTGIVSDVAGITRLLHQRGALAFWDYAAAAPYVEISMRTSGMDALFISPHKLIGGPGSPGVLLMKRSLCQNSVPADPGGGTVGWVNRSAHRYLSDVEHREEGGTPDIIGSIRAGMVFQLKQAVGVEYIRGQENDFLRRCFVAWSKNPNIVVLGNQRHERISIISFMVRHGGGYLHWGYVVTLLNDLFGIQARGGCSCAGPYGHQLLGLTEETSEALQRLVLAGVEGVRPGWARINFNYFITEAAFQFLVQAVDFVASHGYQLLPLYEFDPASGAWRHRDGYPEPPMRLGDISYVRGRMEFASRHARVPESALPGYLLEAQRVVDGALASYQGRSIEDPSMDEEAERLRWFPLPGEVLRELQGQKVESRRSVFKLGR